MQNKLKNTIYLALQIEEIVNQKFDSLNKSGIIIVDSNKSIPINPLGNISEFHYAILNSRNLFLLNITINLNKEINETNFKIKDYYKDDINFNYLDQLLKEKNIEYEFWGKNDLNGNPYAILMIDYSFEKEKILKK